ncbi:MAG: EAL domain-containing protein [Negativicutes bacterium]
MKSSNQKMSVAQFGFRTIFVGIGFIAFSLIWGLVAMQIDTDYQTRVENIQRENSNLAKSFEVHLRRTLVSSDNQLKVIQGEYERENRITPAIKAVWAAESDDAAIIQNAIIDDHGNYIAGKVLPPPDMRNLAHRDYFQAHRDSAGLGLIISKPLFSNAAKKWSMVLSRRLNNPDGSFKGIVSSSLSTDYFEQFYRQMTLFKGDVIALNSTDGMVLVRVGQDKVEMGLDAKQSALYRFVEKKPVDSILISSIDAETRFVSYRVLPDYPLIVVVGVNRDQALASYRHRRLIYILIASCISLLIIAFGYIIARHRNREIRAQKAQMVSNEKYLKIFSVSPDSVTINRIADGLYLDANQGFTKLLGYTRDEAIGKTSRELSIWANIEERSKWTGILKEKGEVVEYEADFRTKSGDIRSCDTSAKLIELEGEQCVLTVTRDITIRKQKDREIFNLNQCLEKNLQEMQDLNASLEEEIDERMQVEETLRHRETALKRSHETLSLAMELAHLGPWEYNQETDLFEFGDDFYTVLKTDEAGEGRFISSATYIQEFVHPDDVWIVANEMKKAADAHDHGYSSQVAHRVICRDGEVRTIAVQVHTIAAASGKAFNQYGVIQDITERVKIEEALLQKTDMIRHMAYFDALTDLPNRRYLHERLEEELERTRRYSSQGVAFFIDMDDLKLVNDTYGHTCGDEIIVASGARIVAEMGEGAFVSRIGGDEFFAILPEVNDQPQVRDIAQRVLNALSQKHEMCGTHFHMTASIGIAFYPTDGNTVEEIIKDADNAMYAAKNAGKNCWQFYAVSMQADKFHQMQLTNDLRYAIEREELLVHYQPQVMTSSQSVVGFEALLRWNSAEHGKVSPLQFIPLAEQSDLIYSIGQWVIQEACRFACRLSDQGRGTLRVAVNISAKQLIADNFIAIIRNAIREAGIEPQQLELEVTESMLMVSVEEVICKLNALKALGVNVTLDDFGTGYSSLTYLRRLPIDTVKIDKSFIDQMMNDDHVDQVVGSIITMAHILGMTVVAEGVEEEQQFMRLFLHGCDSIQGYLFSQPLPEEEAIQYKNKKWIS